MSKSLESQVWQSALDAELKPLAAVMADMGNDDGLGIYPSVEYLGWLLGRSERAIQRGLKSLCRLGILDRVANALGGRGLTPRYRLFAEKLPARPSWKETRKGDSVTPFQKQKGDINDQKGDTVTPDPLVEPLEVGIPPTPRKSYKEPKPASDTSLAQTELMNYLSALGGGHVPHRQKQQAALARMLARHRPDDIRSCLDYYRAQGWRQTAVTWVTVENEIDQWLQRPSEEKKEQTNESRNVRNIRKSLEYLNGGAVPEGGGDGNHQGAALLLVAGTKP